MNQPDRAEMPDRLKSRPEIPVLLTRDSWETVIQTLGYANNPPTEIPGIREEIKDQVEGGRIGGKP